MTLSPCPPVTYSPKLKLVPVDLHLTGKHRNRDLERHRFSLAIGVGMTIAAETFKHSAVQIHGTRAFWP